MPCGTIEIEGAGGGEEPPDQGEGDEGSNIPWEAVGVAAGAMAFLANRKN